MFIAQALAVLNGTIGDYLSRSNNGLATRMGFFRDGARIALDTEALRVALPRSCPRLCVFVHGLMCTEQIWRFPDGSDYGTRLAADFGFESLFVRFNSGRAVAESGAELAHLLEALHDRHPAALEELLLVGYSMGGLVSRHACRFAEGEGHAWLGKVRRAIYMGTPHTGAPAERLGRLITQVLGHIEDPYTRMVRELGDLRSQGIKDLGDGYVSARRALHPRIRHCLIAGELPVATRIAVFGDAMVPVASATNGLLGRDDGDTRVRVLPGLGHMALARHPLVYGEMRAFLSTDSPGAQP